MDGSPSETATHDPARRTSGARDPWALLLEIRNEQRFLRATLEALLRVLGAGAAAHLPASPGQPPTARQEARGIALLQRALARREAAAGEGDPAVRNSRC